MVAEPYRIKRLMSFINPFADCSGDGYQVCQSLLALHHGGLLGQGPGESSAKLLYLPEPYNDFIAAVLGEELGLWGICVLIGFYFLFAWRGFGIARRAADPFGGLLASTFTTMIVAQACLNLGVVTSMVPPKGLVLPFISYGASAMMVNLAAVGILLSISAEAKESAGERTAGSAVPGGSGRGTLPVGAAPGGV
jgi:cell division protein FtsW